jgi:uncharacterized membrane protein YjdF
MMMIMKKFRNINTFILISLIIINIFFIEKNIIDGEFNKLLDSGLLFVMLYIPFLVKKIFKINLSELFKFLYYIYTIITVLIGEIIGLIDTTLWFDKIAHCYFGFLMALIALLFIKYNKKDLKKNVFFNILFIIGFTMLIADCWEFIEFTADKIFHTNNQRSLQTCVDDTMFDLLVAFLGSIVISINYFIEVKRNKCGLVFNSIRNDNKLSK